MSSLLPAALHACSDTVAVDARHFLTQEIVFAGGTRYVPHCVVTEYKGGGDIPAEWLGRGHSWVVPLQAFYTAAAWASVLPNLGRGCTRCFANPIPWPSCDAAVGHSTTSLSPNLYEKYLLQFVWLCCSS